MKARSWRALRWAAAIGGLSVFACTAVGRLTSSRSPPESGAEFDHLVEAVAPEPSAPDAGAASPPAPDEIMAPSQRCLDRRRPELVGQINLNTATIAELIALPGIGESKASRIVEYRSHRGPFRRIRDLRRVKGFGRKTVAKLKPHLVIAGPNTLRLE